MPKMPGLVVGLGVTFRGADAPLFPKRGLKTIIPAPSTGAATSSTPTCMKRPHRGPEE